MYFIISRVSDTEKKKHMGPVKTQDEGEEGCVEEVKMMDRKESDFSLCGSLHSMTV